MTLTLLLCSTELLNRKKKLIITKRNRHTENIVKIRNISPSKCQMTQKIFGISVVVEVCKIFWNFHATISIFPVIQ